ncbi:hypothetical protein MMC29_003530 [Sticta canariensis]|nr:hypothetical protein [Sticta canariensis]
MSSEEHSEDSAQDCSGDAVGLLCNRCPLSILRGLESPVWVADHREQAAAVDSKDIRSTATKAAASQTADQSPPAWHKAEKVLICLKCRSSLNLRLLAGLRERETMAKLKLQLRSQQRRCMLLLQQEWHRREEERAVEVLHVHQRLKAALTTVNLWPQQLLLLRQNSLDHVGILLLIQHRRLATKSASCSTTTTTRKPVATKAVFVSCLFCLLMARLEEREGTVAAVEAAQAARQEALEHTHSQCLADAQSTLHRLQVRCIQALTLISLLDARHPGCILDLSFKVRADNALQAEQRYKEQVRLLTKELECLQSQQIIQSVCEAWQTLACCTGRSIHSKCVTGAMQFSSAQVPNDAHTAGHTKLKTWRHKHAHERMRRLSDERNQLIADGLYSEADALIAQLDGELARCAHQLASEP